MHADPDVEHLVALEPDDLNAAHALATEHGVALVELPTKGIEPVAGVTVILLGSALAVGTVANLLDRRKGGQVIDLRPGASRVLYRSRDLIYGLVVLVAIDGTVTIQVREPKGMFGTVVAAVKDLIVDLSGAPTVADISAV